MSYRSIGIAATAFFMMALGPPPVHADPALCQKQIVRQLLGYKRTYLRVHAQCLDKQNVGRIPGPCPDALSQLRIQMANARVVARIADKCTLADIAALGFPANCNFEPETTGKEGACAAMAVATPQDFAECIKCWKEAELSEFLGIIYASHAVELCGTLDANSATCSNIPCAAPLPIQRDLGDTGEEDCQRGIARAGNKYLVDRERILEMCGLAGRTRANCLADPKVQLSLATAESRKENLIRLKCGNRDPVANPPFCCRTGTGQICTAAATREDCVDVLLGDVMEGKFCDIDNTCANDPGPAPFTWWEFCPEPNTCGTATPLTSIDDAIACVDAVADQIADELLCMQFRGNGGADWPCPPES